MIRNISILAIALFFGSLNAAEREWNTYQPGGGACYVKFPANPEYQTQTVDVTPTHIYVAKDTSHSPAFVYSVGIGDYPKEKLADKDLIKKQIDSDRDGFAKSVNGKVLSDKPGTVEKTPCRAITFSGDDGLARYVLREFVVENRV